MVKLLFNAEYHRDFIPLCLANRLAIMRAKVGLFLKSWYLLHDCSWLGVLLVVLFLGYTVESKAQAKVGVRTVTIDAGHGGKDPGTMGQNSKEKNVTLAVALRLGEKIKKNHPDVKVVYTRDKDVFIELDARSAIANDAKSDLFISIHCNSSPAVAAKGVETFVMGWHKAEDQFEVAKRENSVITFETDYTKKYDHFDPSSPESYIIFSLMQNVFHDQSIEFAALVQQNFVKQQKRVDREVKQAGFLVLYKSSMPAVLIELGFLSNKKEEAYLLSKKGQEETAEAIYQAFKTYKESRESVQQKEETSIPKDSAKGEQARVAGKRYLIQVASVTEPIEAKHPLRREFPNLIEWRDGKRYRYFTDRYASYAEAEKALKAVKEKYADAFIVAFED